MSNNRTDIPEEDHVVRYCRPAYVRDGKISSSAFELRGGECYLSANWMEYFKGKTANQQLECIRKTVNLQVKPNGRFARLSVGNAKNSIDGLQIKSIAGRNNPSHAGIYSDRDENRNRTLELATIVRPEDIFPAL